MDIGEVDNIEAACTGFTDFEWIADISHQSFHGGRRIKYAFLGCVGLGQEFRHAVLRMYLRELPLMHYISMNLLTGPFLSPDLHAPRFHNDGMLLSHRAGLSKIE